MRTSPHDPPKPCEGGWVSRFCGRPCLSGVYALTVYDNKLIAGGGVYHGWEYSPSAYIAIWKKAPCDCGVWGDVNVNPVDVVKYINYVYKGHTDAFCADPCAQ